MRYTQDKLEAIAAKLREMPTIEKKVASHSKQEAVKVLVREIESLQKRGYTLDQISETLRGEGLDIATPTLKSYMQRAKPVRKKGKSAGKQDTPPAARRPSSQSVSGAKSSFEPKPDSAEI
jgi:hypothetical protein